MLRLAVQFRKQFVASGNQNSIGRETSRLKFRSLHYFAPDQFRLGALRRKIIYDRLHVVRPSIIQPCGGSGSAVQRFALHSIRDTYLGEDEIMKTIRFAFAALTVAVLARSEERRVG